MIWERSFDVKGTNLWAIHNKQVAAVVGVTDVKGTNLWAIHNQFMWLGPDGKDVKGTNLWAIHNHAEGSTSAGDDVKGTNLWAIHNGMAEVQAELVMSKVLICEQFTTAWVQTIRNEWC